MNFLKKHVSQKKKELEDRTNEEDDAWTSNEEEDAWTSNEEEDTWTSNEEEDTDERNSLYYIELIKADPAKKKEEGYPNSWPFYVSIGKIWSNSEIYKEKELFFIQETMGEYERKKKRIILKDAIENKKMEILFRTLFKSGLFLYLHTHTEDWELNYNDDFLYDTLQRLFRVKGGKVEKEFKEVYDNEYLCNPDEANEVVNFGKDPTSKAIVKTCITTYETLDGHLEYLYDRCMEFITEPSSDDLVRRQGSIENLKNEFLQKKSEIGILMYNLVVSLTSMFLPNSSKLILSDSKCILTIEKIIFNCFDNLKEDLFPGEKSKKKSIEKIKKIMLPENNSDLSWFHFTQLAMEEVYLILKQSRNTINFGKNIEKVQKYSKRSTKDFMKNHKVSEKEYANLESYYEKHKKNLTKKLKQATEENLLVSAKKISDRKENMNPENRKYLKILLKNQEILLKKSAKRNEKVDRNLLEDLNKIRRQLGKNEISPILKNKLLTDSTSWKLIQNVNFHDKRAPLLLKNGNIVDSIYTTNKNTKKLIKDSKFT